MHTTPNSETHGTDTFPPKLIAKWFELREKYKANKDDLCAKQKDLCGTISPGSPMIEWDQLEHELISPKWIAHRSKQLVLQKYRYEFVKYECTSVDNVAKCLSRFHEAGDKLTDEERSLFSKFLTNVDNWCITLVYALCKS
jgi:hypothetical protein